MCERSVRSCCFLGHRGLDLRNYAPALLWPGVNDDPASGAIMCSARASPILPTETWIKLGIGSRRSRSVCILTAAWSNENPPRKQRKAQIDRRAVERVHSVGEINPEVLRRTACCTERGQAVGMHPYCREVWFLCRIKPTLLAVIIYPSGEAASDKLAEYDAALRQRGSLTVWFSEEAIAGWKASPRTTRGASLYSRTWRSRRD